MGSRLLLNFLKESKLLYSNAGKSRCCHVILGNESCDMDSAVCAIALAYYYSQVNKDTATKCFLPMFNIQSTDYPLRTEITFALNKINISKDDLIFNNNIYLDELKDTQRLNLTLVDHNILSGQNSGLDKCVVEVLDHHKHVKSAIDCKKVTIEMVGSCATLVAEKILKDQSFTLPQELAVLLHGTILLDTICLSEQAGRKTKKDEDMVTLLEQYMSESSSNRQKLFDQLQAAKMDVSGLSNTDILRKDLKIIRSEIVSLAMSSIPIKLKDFDTRSPTLCTDLQDFTSSQDVDGVVIMTLTVTDTGEAERELALFCSEQSLKKKIVEVLCGSTNPNLELTPMAECFGNIKDMTAFSQSNVSASRKKVLPLLQDFINK